MSDKEKDNVVDLNDFRARHKKQLNRKQLENKLASTWKQLENKPASTWKAADVDPEDPVQWATLKKLVAFTRDVPSDMLDSEREKLIYYVLKTNSENGRSLTEAELAAVTMWSEKAIINYQIFCNVLNGDMAMQYNDNGTVDFVFSKELKND